MLPAPQPRTLSTKPLYIHHLQPPHAAATIAKISHHEARTSLLGGQPRDGTYPPYANTSYKPPYPPQPSFDTQPGGYHHREGFPTTLPPPVRRAPRMYIPNTRWTWAFMLTAIFQIIIALCLESYVCHVTAACALLTTTQICLW
jgi:hypothetical protein